MIVRVEKARAQLVKNFPKMQTGRILSELSSIGIGGPADLYYRLEKTEELEPLLEEAERLKIPYIVLGGGTNILFADEGFRGLVIHMMARRVALEPSNESGYGIISAEAGALVAQIIAFALKNNLSGLEKLMGLPGTIGGAVRGNAGAYGTEIKDVFLKARLYTPDKGLHEAGHGYFKFSYRTSAIKATKDIIIKVFLRLEAKDCTQAVAEATEIVKTRITKQPKGPSTGSFFKNPGKDLSAGYLLDQCGCKGLQIGGAQVSREHANWIINRGGATRAHVLELAGIMQERVKSRFDITLEPEVQIVGEASLIHIVKEGGDGISPESSRGRGPVPA
jgi:UDP-N-acetylmuramate dehydrogenase